LGNNVLRGQHFGKRQQRWNFSLAPWKTLARVSSFSFAPGSRILLKRGSLWREELNFPSSGVSDEPILLLMRMGTGNAPVISGADLLPITAWTVCSNCQQYIWQIPAKTQPNIVLFNGTLGKHESSIANLNGTTEWYWSGGTLYVWFTGTLGTPIGTLELRWARGRLASFCSACLI